MSVTLFLVILSGFLSFRAFNDEKLFQRLKHHPYSVHNKKEYYRMLTSGFIHGDWMHLIINMYVLYEFGNIVEELYIQLFNPILGRILYLLMYLAVLVIADIPSFRKHKNNPAYASIGASGAVSGVLFTYVLFFPWSWLGLFFVIPIPAIIFGVLYLVYSSWAARKMDDRIDHSAHFAGAIAGMVIMIMLYPGIISLFLENITQITSPW